jgi:hypothetical protein
LLETGAGSFVVNSLAIRRSEFPKIADARVQYKDIEIFDGLLGEQQVANGAACDHGRAIESDFDAAQECRPAGGNAFMLIIFYP